MAQLTDEQMAALEAKAGHLSDEQMAAKENAHRAMPVNPTMGERLAGMIRRQREQLPSKLRSAAMGLYSNAASIPEEVLATITEPGQNEGWHTEHPEIREKYMRDVEAQPGSNIVGAMLQPSPIGKLSGASKIAKVGAAGARVGQAGANASLADYLGQTGPKAQDSGDAATLPMVVQAGAEVLSPVAGKVAGKLRRTAGTAAVNAAGMRGGIVNQPKRAGIHSLDDEGEDAIAGLGNRMLDQGLIPFGGSKLAVQRRAEKLMDRTASAAEGLRAQGDALGEFSQAEGVAAAAGRLAKRTDPSVGGNLQTARTAGPAGEFIADASNSPNTFKAADDLKRGAYRSTNWGTEAKDATVLKRETVSGYRQSMEDQLDRLIPGAGEDLHKVNEGYGLAAQTADFAEEAAGREKANSKFGWGSMMLGASGLTAGNAIGPSAGIGLGVGLPVAAHLLKTRGAAVGAPLSRLGSKGAALAGDAANQSPAAAGPVSNALEDYLKPKDDEQRQEDAAAWFTGAGR